MFSTRKLRLEAAGGIGNTKRLIWGWWNLQKVDTLILLMEDIWQSPPGMYAKPVNNGMFSISLGAGFLPTVCAGV